MIFALAILAEFVAIRILWAGLRNAIAPAPQASPQVTAREPSAPPQIDADAVDREMSEVGKKALLVLLRRYGQRVDTEGLLAMISAADRIDRPLGRASISRDLDAARRLGLVTVDQLHGYTLTPAGRDWLLDAFGKLEQKAAPASKFQHLRDS